MENKRGAIYNKCVDTDRVKIGDRWMGDGIGKGRIGLACESRKKAYKERKGVKRWT